MLDIALPGRGGWYSISFHQNCTGLLVMLHVIHDTGFYAAMITG